MDTIYGRFIWFIRAASIAFVAYIQNNGLLVVVEEFSGFTIELNEINSIVAFPSLFVHYDFCDAWHATIWWSIQF